MANILRKPEEDDPKWNTPFRFVFYDENKGTRQVPYAEGIELLNNHDITGFPSAEAIAAATQLYGSAVNCLPYDLFLTFARREWDRGQKPWRSIRACWVLHASSRRCVSVVSDAKVAHRADEYPMQLRRMTYHLREHTAFPASEGPLIINEDIAAAVPTAARTPGWFLIPCKERRSAIDGRVFYADHTFDPFDYGEEHEPMPMDGVAAERVVYSVHQNNI